MTKMTAAAKGRSHQSFSIRWIRKYLPHYLTNEPSDLHRELVADLASLHTRRGRHLNRIAPRGSAKSTIVSKAYPLYCAVEGVEPFILLLSDAESQSNGYIDAIKHELEGNPVLAADYPAACEPGPVWQAGRIRLRNGCEVTGKGSGGRIRGVAKWNRRPTLVIIDDANTDADVFSPRQRERRLSWLNKGVMPIGEPGTNFLSVGTPIHREAIVCDLARQGGWETKSYRSVLTWPVRLDLWHRWELMFANLSDADRAATSRRFYESNRSDMDAGSSVLWPDRFPLYELMCKRAVMGDVAFRCEYQDEPGVSGSSEWGPESFDHTDFWVTGLPPKGERAFTVQFLDPSKGRADKSSDYQAHTVACLGADGLWYCDGDMRREDPTRMATRAADLCDIWQPDCFGVEDNGTMGLIAGEIDDLVRKGRFAGVKLDVVTSKEPKEFRIRSLSPYICRRQIRVVGSAGGRLMVSQIRDFPNGEFDDGADSLASAVRRIELAYGWRT